MHSRPVGVLHVIDGTEVGGAEQSLMSFFGAVDRQIVQPFVAISRGPQLEWFAQSMSNLAVPFTVFDAHGWRRRKPLPYLGNILSIARAIRRFDARVVHVNQPLFHTDTAFWAARLCSVPTAVHIRMVMGSSRDECWFVANYGRYLQNAKSLICVSESSRDALGVHRIPRERAVVIYNGIDTNRFSPCSRTGALRRTIGVSENTPLIGYAGRIVEEKGLVELVQAVATARERIPNLHLVLLGDIDIDYAKPLVARLRADAERFHMSEALHTPGFCERADEWIADFDVLVMPSWQEAFGRSIAEAMACEVVPVACAVGGIPEVIRNGVDGLLVPPRCPQKIAEAICALYEEPELRRKMALAGRNRVQTVFSLDENVRRLTELFVSIARI
ncbi:MAG: glycosyltransferase family 4 protein [Armatimonadota bacterium]